MYWAGAGAANANTSMAGSARTTLRRRHAIPTAANPTRTSVPGSGTGVGVNTKSISLLAWLSTQSNRPGCGFRNPAVSKIVDASSVAVSVGPVYVPA